MKRYTATLGFTLFAIWIAVVFVLASCQPLPSPPPALELTSRAPEPGPGALESVLGQRQGSREVHSRLRLAAASANNSPSPRNTRPISLATVLKPIELPMSS